MLQFRPFFADPAGTRPSMPGCFLDPGPQRTSGVALNGGSARRTGGPGAGVSPLPWPSANRSFRGLADGPDVRLTPAVAAPAAAGHAIAAATPSRTAPLITRRIRAIPRPRSYPDVRDATPPRGRCAVSASGPGPAAARARTTACRGE